MADAYHFRSYANIVKFIQILKLNNTENTCFRGEKSLVVVMIYLQYTTSFITTYWMGGFLSFSTGAQTVSYDITT